VPGATRGLQAGWWRPAMNPADCDVREFHPSRRELGADLAQAAALDVQFVVRRNVFCWSGIGTNSPASKSKPNGARPPKLSRTRCARLRIGSSDVLLRAGRRWPCIPRQVAPQSRGRSVPAAAAGG
jgi:hypothetical protein